MSNCSSTNGITSPSAEKKKSRNDFQQLRTNNTQACSASPHHTNDLLKLAVLACEPKPPYGPNRHTSEILLKLLTNAAANGTETTESGHDIVLDVFNVQEEAYPQDWDAYHGVLIPGSFSSAYDQDEWIEVLKKKIQKHIVQAQKPTLAICFGHQILAQSFDTDESSSSYVIATPTGPRAGQHMVTWTETGAKLLVPGDDRKELPQFFSHGDMVQRLPPSGVCLGGNDQVPIQIAAYYGDCTNATSTKPFAISFQAHPEYTTEDDLATLHGCMQAMEDRQAISSEVHAKASQVARDNHEQVRRDNVAVIHRVGQLLGWWI